MAREWPTRRGAGRASACCRRLRAQGPKDSSGFPGLPELDDVLFADDCHLAPALFVVGCARVRHREVIVGRNDATHLVQRLGARLAGKDLVLERVPTDSLVGGQTARPQDSSASRPASVMRATVQGGSHTTLTLTSVTPASRSSRSRTSSRMNSDAGQPMAVKVSSTSTTPSCSVIP